MGLLRHLGGLVVANERVERRHQHQRVLDVVLNLLIVGLEALNAELAETVTRIGEQVNRVTEVVDDDGLAHVEFQVAPRSRNCDGFIPSLSFNKAVNSLNMNGTLLRKYPISPTRS